MRKSKTTTNNTPLMYQRIGSFGDNEEYLLCKDTSWSSDLCIVESSGKSVIGHVTKADFSKEKAWGCFLIEGELLRFIGRADDSITASKMLVDTHCKPRKAKAR